MKEKDLWFKRKTYGYGWYPITWQGWASIVIYILFNLFSILGLEKVLAGNEKLFVITSTIIIVISTSILIFISYKKGEKPRWQWGEEKQKK